MDTSAIVLASTLPPAAQSGDTAQPGAAQDASASSGIEVLGFAAALEQQIAQSLPALGFAVPADAAATADGEAAPAPGEPTTSPDGIIALISAPLLLQSTAPAAALAEQGAAAVVAIDAQPPDARPAGALSAERLQQPVDPRASSAAAPGAATRAAAFDAPDVRETPADPRPLELDRVVAAPAQAVDVPQSAPPGFTAAASLLHADRPVVHAERQIAATVGSPGWDDGFARQVTLVVKEGEQSAQLRLDPPDLGPLEVRVSMSSDREGVAHAQFVSAHASVREAIESALPQLRAVLAENGITLGQASVGEGFVRDDARDGSQPGAASRGGEPRSDEPISPVQAGGVKRGLVDTFA